MIKLENVTKYYRTLKGKKYILNNVTMEFPEGKNIGLLGRNGSGKTTLLRMIGGIETPNSGVILHNENISPPFGMAGGFAKQLSGRDNAKFVCRVHGDDKKTMADRLEYIAEFSELGEFFDMPISSYSSGMGARLKFAISMAFEYDYYLIDELISVGDQKFRQKAQKAFSEKRGKATVILVSHNMKLQEHECDVGVYLRNGQAYYFDDIKDAISTYLKAEG